MAALDVPSDDHTALSSWTRTLSVLFFFSGFPALMYQLTWQRALFRIFGVNIESVTIVVTAFMLGLGLGSLAGGFLSERRGMPVLPLLATIELATGAFGIFSLDIFERVGTLSASWPLPAMAVVNLALVIVPTLLMGATLPLLVSHLVHRSGQVGSAVGLLYYVNTLGAGAACLVCMVLFFPLFGLQGTVYVAAAMNGAVAIGALIMHSRGWTRSEQALPSPSTSSARLSPQVAALRFVPVLALAAGGGFVSLSYEIFFFRTVSYVSGSSATAFAATLCAFLVGLASGARRAGHDCEILSRAQAARRAVGALVTANLLGALFLPMLAWFAWFPGVIGLAILMVYVVARYWGCLLPYLAEFGVNVDSRVGMHTAYLYLANILGAALGSIITGFVLMDRISLVAIGVTLVVLGSICGALLALVLGTPHSPRNRMNLIASAAMTVLALLAIPRLASDVLERLQRKGSNAEAKPFVQVVENRSGIITVDANGTVFGNGMYDGRFNTDLKHDTNGILRPYALSLFHPAPRDVLMIGLSSGSWAQVIAHNPNVASLTIVEINPGYEQIVALNPEVASVLSNPKVKIITDDGRRWLRRNQDRRFDAIVQNTTWHFRANVTNLLSSEFLALIKSSLNPTGLFFYNTTDSARVQRTGCVAFAEGARFTNHMVVSSIPIAWDFSRWRRTLQSYVIDGRPVFNNSRSEDREILERLMAMETSLTSGASQSNRPIEPCTDILARTAVQDLISDDNMGAEWRYFLGLE